MITTKTASDDANLAAAFAPLDAPTVSRASGGIEALWRSDAYNTALALLLAAGLAWAPFWLGGDRRLPWGVNAILFPALAAAYELGLMARGLRHPYAIKQILGPAALFLIAIAWIAVQVSPYVPSPLAHPIWALAANGLGSPVAATISVDPSLSLLALMRLLTEASVLWLALQLGRNVSLGLFLLHALVVVVAAYCAYGLFLAAGLGGTIPLFDVTPVPGLVRSTFVNRNSFATYAGLGLVTAVALILRLYRHEVPDAAGLVSFRMTRLIDATGRRGVFWLAAALVISVALLGSVSRGGILSAGLGLTALFVLSATRRKRRRGEQIETLVFVGVAVLATFLVFGDRIVGRITDVGLTDASRLAVDTIVYNAILDTPLIGFGYGTFADVFPMYRDQSISPVGVWDMAHNTYLEVWLGLGLVFGSALMGSVIWLGVKCLRGAVRRRRDATAPIVATAAALLVGSHALVDFSLQIDAVGLTFVALLGLGLAQAESSSRSVSD